MSTSMSPNRGWNITLWVLQILVAIAFGLSGAMKVATPFDALNKAMPWTIQVGEPMVRFIGSTELAGSLGLLLPALTRILPFLTPLAALGLTTDMVLAAGFHVSRGEPSVLPVNLVLGGLAFLIFWGRTRKAPIAARASAPPARVAG